MGEQRERDNRCIIGHRYLRSQTKPPLFLFLSDRLVLALIDAGPLILIRQGVTTASRIFHSKRCPGSPRQGSVMPFCIFLFYSSFPLCLSRFVAEPDTKRPDFSARAYTHTHTHIQFVTVFCSRPLLDKGSSGRRRQVTEFLWGNLANWENSLRCRLQTLVLFEADRIQFLGIVPQPYQFASVPIGRLCIQNHHSTEYSLTFGTHYQHSLGFAATYPQPLR
jgi:hypothetical protein